MLAWDQRYGSSGPAFATSAAYLCSSACTKRRVSAPYDCVLLFPSKLLQACRSSRLTNFMKTSTKLGNQGVLCPKLATPMAKSRAHMGLRPPLMELSHPRVLFNRPQFTLKISPRECVVLVYRDCPSMEWVGCLFDREEKNLPLSCCRTWKGK